MIFSTATTGLQDMRLPQWGRSFWQDPNDGELFLAYASGTTEVDFITSVDAGQSWSEPELLFPVDDFSIHNNFDTVMDRDGHIHCGFRYNDSGCYQFVGKASGGGWTISSGIGPVAWITAGDSGVAGYQGSLTMQPTKYFSDIAVPYPAVKMVGKDSNDNIATAVLGTPFNITPTPDLMDFSSTHAGPNGGFPIIFPDGLKFATFGRRARISYLDDVNRSIKTWERSGFSSEYVEVENIALGQGDIGFAPNMAIGSGIGPGGTNGITLVCTASGQAVYVNEEETDFINTYKNAEDISNGTDLFWRRKAGFNAGAQPITSGIVPTGLIYGVGPNDFSGMGVTVHGFPGAGTNCDFSFNDAGEMIYYFQMKNPSGKQAIGRYKSNYSFGNWKYPDINDEDQGLKYIASVNKTHTGGFSNTLFWGGFKALRHPTEPSAGGNKLELLVTQGHVPTYPSGGSLTVWNVEDSPGLSKWQIPDYSIDYTATSGTPYEVFSGIRSFTNVKLSSHYGELPNMFDGDNTTRGRIRDGYTLGLELVGPQTIDRIEVLTKNLTFVSRMAISGSFDADTWNRVVTIPSGRHIVNSYNRGNALLKYQSMGQTVTEDQNTQDNEFGNGELVINNIDPFVAKYINFQFEYPLSGSASIHEIKLYGPGASSPELITWSDDSTDPPPYNLLQYRTSFAHRTENFRTQQGTLPLGWTSYGDFEWRVVGSGNSTKTTSEEPADFDGTVQSGIWSIINQQRGTDDGFSLRSEAIGDASGLANPLGPVPSAGIQPGQSGVVEVKINIRPGEYAENFGVPSRTIGFNLRADVHIDDSVQFFTLTPLEAAVPGHTGLLRISYGDFGWNNPPDILPSVTDPYSTALLGAGEHTLRWVYNKGAYDPVNDSFIAPMGSAWIDNVFGLDGVVEKSRHGFVSSAMPLETGVIHGYVSSFGTSAIHGVIPLVSPLESSLNGYVVGYPQGTVLSDNINGFLKGNGVSVNGYVLATSGVTTRTFPTGSIYGYISVADSGIDSNIIHGYMDGGNYSSIYGYMNGADILANVVPTGNLKIHGYVKAQYPVSQIYGVVGGPVETFDKSIYAYTDARFGLGDQTIHGYIGGPSGVATTFINGHLLGWDGGVNNLGVSQKAIWGFIPGKTETSGNIHGFTMANKPFSTIHGYMGSEGLVASGGGAVGNPSTSNVPAGVNLVNGYLKAYDGFQIIHGFIGGEPTANSIINGYMLGALEPTIIHGRLVGHMLSSGVIHGHLNAIGFNPSSIHGHGFGISGVIDSQIHGYTVGVNIPVSTIHGITIGIPQIIPSVDSSSYCPSHNYPLPLPLSITLPSKFIN